MEHEAELEALREQEQERENAAANNCACAGLALLPHSLSVSDTLSVALPTCSCASAGKRPAGEARAVREGRSGGGKGGGSREPAARVQQSHGRPQAYVGLVVRPRCPTPSPTFFSKSLNRPTLPAAVGKRPAEKPVNPFDAESDSEASDDEDKGAPLQLAPAAVAARAKRPKDSSEARRRRRGLVSRAVVRLSSDDGGSAAADHGNDAHPAAAIPVFLPPPPTHTPA